MITTIILGFVGIILMVFGYFLWKKERITLLHSYHYDKVSEKDKKIFCTISGIGVLSVGIGIFLTGIIIGITNSAWSYLIFATGFVIGLALLIYAGLKYNH